MDLDRAAASDATEAFRRAVEGALRSSELSPDEQQRIRSALVLRPARRRATPFLTASDGVAEAIDQLNDFIASIKRDYTGTGKLTNKEKDNIEQEVAATVKATTQQLDALTHSVVAAQQGAGSGGARGVPAVNQQTAAHLHGVVLVLVERLHEVSAAFDRCRAVRYQQGWARELAAHRDTQQFTQVRQQFTQVRQQFTQVPTTSSSSSSGVEAEDASGQRRAPGQQQQQQLKDPEAKQLLDELVRSSQQAFEIERTVREITTLNQMISTAVMQQAEGIEQLYNTAVEATFNIQRGNKELRKTVALNRSSTRYVLVLIATATAMMIFFDWFYS